MIRRSHEILAGAALAVAVAACQPPPSGGAGKAGAGGAAGTGSPTGSGGTSVCASINESLATKVLPDVLILLDASGSMNEDADGASCDGGCGPTSKWAQATAAINSIVAQTESTVNWGLKNFADSGGSCATNAIPTATVAPMNANAIALAIANRTSANGGVASGSNTPTRAALNAGATVLSTLADTSPKLMLLLTDGVPNCPASGSPSADDSAAALQAVVDARALGFSTIVVGIAAAGGPADTILNDMATAGGHPRAGATPAYTPLSAVAELTTTLPELVPPSASCVFALPAAPTGTQLRIGLRGDGGEIPFDSAHENGWDWTDASEMFVQIFGAPCDDFLAGRIATVAIDFYCGRL